MVCSLSTFIKEDDDDDDDVMDVLMSSVTVMTQVYRPQLVPLIEFGGTGFDAPRRKMKAPDSGHSGLQTQSHSASAVATNPRFRQCFM